MRILLANETAGDQHLGCWAVGDAHARMLGRLGHSVVKRLFAGELNRFHGLDDGQTLEAIRNDATLREAVEAVDAVIVNGEGTVHHNHGRPLLALLAFAQELGKPTLLVNSVFEANTGFEDTLRRLHDLTVRDARSEAALRDKGIRCRLVPDSSLEAGFDTRPSELLAGRLIVTDWHRARNADVGLACKQLLARADDPAAPTLFFPLETVEPQHLWRRVPALWAPARMVVTARHHGVCLALKAGVPFVAMGSNTHKVEGMLAFLHDELPLVQNAAQLDEALQFAADHPEVYQQARERLQDMMPLSTFRCLDDGAHRASAEADEVERLHAQLRSRPSSLDVHGVAFLDYQSWKYRDALAFKA